MAAIPVTCIFDVGKTNKKVLLFDPQYQLVYEFSEQLPETADEDGFPCEDIHTLTDWLRASYARVRADARFDIRGINFSGYGASFVLLDAKGKVIAPLYNYLKPYPRDLQEQFYDRYGGQQQLCRETASPALGSLNSGLQLYRLKHRQPNLFSRTKLALHLPNYLCYLFSGNCVSEITSVGCHTHLWDFTRHQYHTWVQQEGISEKLAPLQSCGSLAGVTADGKPVGVGLHDSSAALIPYLRSFSEPFVLLSTGTWSISLNPFNHTPLSDAELQADCLCYLSNEARQVKASRLFAGREHERHTMALAERFGKPLEYHRQVRYDPAIMATISKTPAPKEVEKQGISQFEQRDLKSFQSYEQAYHQLLFDLVELQFESTGLVLKSAPVKRLFVDGGFSNNNIYMRLIAEKFAGMEVHASSIAQASSLGSALAIHSNWNSQLIPKKLLNTVQYKYP